MNSPIPAGQFFFKRGDLFIQKGSFPIQENKNMMYNLFNIDISAYRVCRPASIN